MPTDQRAGDGATSRGHNDAREDRMKVGQVYAGITGNRMKVTAIDGDRCELTYEDGSEEPWWEDSHDVAEYLTLVKDVA